MEVAPLAEKWKSFGWAVVEIDGNDFSAIDDAFRELEKSGDRPKIIIGHTIKGRGVPYMESNNVWHRANNMSVEDRDRALAAL